MFTPENHFILLCSFIGVLIGIISFFLNKTVVTNESQHERTQAKLDSIIEKMESIHCHVNVHAAKIDGIVEHLRLIDEDLKKMKEEISILKRG